MINYQLVHPLLVLQLGLQIAREILKATLVCINYEDEVFCLQHVTASKRFSVHNHIINLNFVICLSK